ncbi:hypothetical protein LCGC14_1761750 [marine sediment metagenome]|uniref:Uncharacterized protein n=1 Tax=marine sediment metagenome TaxID=412755 RepID=A0A0F9H0W7_9ZZZZ
MAKARRKCPKCRTGSLFFETTRKWGPRLWCLCGYSKELGGPAESDEMRIAKALLGSIDRSIGK